MDYSIKKTADLTLNSLGRINVYLGENKYLNLIKDLKQTPRTGKLVRIEKHSLHLPCQSIYSHITSMSRNADILKKCRRPFTGAESNFIAKACAFHDLAESIIGDVPMFTGKKMSGNHFKNGRQKKYEEKIANGLIANSLTGSLKNDFVKIIDRIENDKTDITKFFHFLDRSEPIIAVWKYIYFHKRQIRIDQFLSSFKDFFISSNALPYSYNTETNRLINFLQNKSIAREYYYQGANVFDKYRGKKLNGADLKRLIENGKLEFVKC